MGVRLSPARLQRTAAGFALPVATGLPGWAGQSSKPCISPQLAPHLSGALLQLWTPSTGSLCTLSVWAGSV